MKKVLSTALILGALYGTANAAHITSPTYLPEAGKILSNIKVGYTTSEFDKVPTGENDEKYKAGNIDLEGKLGLMDQLSLNYGFSFDFSRKERDEDMSAGFDNYYFGVTGRVIDAVENKLDIILNVGQEDSFFTRGQVYVDLALRYGLDLDMYNLGLSAKARYYNDTERDNNKYERDMAFTFALENEFIFTEDFTVGLDLFYTINGKVKYKEDGVLIERTKSFDEYGFNIDANYAVAQDNFIGVYFGMAFSDMNYLDEGYKDPTEYNFGVKYVAQF